MCRPALDKDVQCAIQMKFCGAVWQQVLLSGGDTMVPQPRYGKVEILSWNDRMNCLSFGDMYHTVDQEVMSNEI